MVKGDRKALCGDGQPLKDDGNIEGQWPGIKRRRRGVNWRSPWIIKIIREMDFPVKSHKNEVIYLFLNPMNTRLLFHCTVSEARLFYDGIVISCNQTRRSPGLVSEWSPWITEISGARHKQVKHHFLKNHNWHRIWPWIYRIVKTFQAGTNWIWIQHKKIYKKNQKRHYICNTTRLGHL